MDQHIEQAKPESIDEAMDAVIREDGSRVIRREGKAPVVIMSVATYLRMKPAPEWLRESWAQAKQAGLDTMTMDEIDEEIAAYHREQTSTSDGRL